jgi:UDP:flavonoid glycosyltransferase YjiC (YdhE family)/Flp pilus assembly protein TadD
MARPEPAAAVTGGRGLQLAKQGRFEEALASLDAEEGLERVPQARNTRGMILTALGRLDEAQAEFEHALALRPEFPDAINNCGTVHARRGDFEQARACYERSLALAPEQVHARYNLSTTLLVLGEWERGFREFETRWKLFPHEAVRRNRLAPVWMGEEDIRGKTVLLHHEQGYGDALQFCRYAPLVARRGARVILAVPRALRTVMETLGAGVRIVAEGDPLPSHDYCCALMSLPLVFGTTPATTPADVPYLRADPGRVAEWGRRLGPRSRARIGIVWSGRRYPPINHPRDIPLETVCPLFDLDAQFLALQQGLTPAERERLARHPNVTLHGEELEDFADTAALIEHLDLLITVDTAVAHLAGARGKPVWLLNRLASCWRWLLERADSPWYPTMRLFRQRSLGDWQAVVEQVRAAGEALIATLPAARTAGDEAQSQRSVPRRPAMQRILLTWELGLNLGHLARLLPLAEALKQRGHAVLVAARDLTAAAQVLAPAGISFVQAPHLAHGHPLPHRAAGYSDILRAQGWGDVATLRGLSEGWINLYRMFRPDLIVADYSPTAILAAHIARRPHLLIGNGFELPPAVAPLPPFPGFSWATAEQAAESEALVLENAGRVAEAFRGAKLGALRELVSPARALFATWPELDHYGPRDGASYIGPLLGKIGGPPIAWPSEKRASKVFACLRPDTEHVGEILCALKRLDANLICVAPGFSDAQLGLHAAPNIAFSRGLVDLSSLMGESDLCLSYGAEGTVSAFLLAGVPQVISPRQVEAYMAVRRIETLGAGLALRGRQSADSVKQTIETVLSGSGFAESARRLRDRHGGEVERSIGRAVDEIERAAGAREDRASGRAAVPVANGGN